jgi:phosphatidylglycerol:prolipoprotein diacylglycerol transferase
MFPVILELGPITLHSYGLMIALGFLAALGLMQRDARRAGLDPAMIGEMAFWSLFIGVAATRVLHIIMYSENYSWSNPFGWIAIWQGGLVFQGAIPAVFLYAWWGLRKRGIPFWKAPDVVLPWIPLAQAFGRMGCFLNGCCFGLRADHLPWAVRFPEGSPPFNAHSRLTDFMYGVQTTSFPVHPTQLYSVGLLLTMCLALFLMRRYWRPFEGFTVPLFLGLYGVKRFIVEMFRGDGNPTELGFGLLSNQQVFALGMVGLGVVLFFYLRPRLARVPWPKTDPPAAA